MNRINSKLETSAWVYHLWKQIAGIFQDELINEPLGKAYDDAFYWFRIRSAIRKGYKRCEE